MRYVLSVNGLDNAFPREFGCNCPRCQRSERAANMSMSLIGLDDPVAHAGPLPSASATRFHALIDCGHGVSESLSANPFLRGECARLDWFLFTHWHSDHSAELGRIGATWMRTCARRGQTFQPVRAWCREGSAEWLALEHPNAWRAFAMPHIAPGFDNAGVVLDAVPTGVTDLSITPITLHHASADVAPPTGAARRPSCAGFVIETGQRKAVLFWDMDNTNQWITQPENDAQRRALALASDADYLCLDCNTWRFAGAPAKTASHASFFTQLPNIRALQPKQTLLVHLSGHEDARGDGFGWRNTEWEAQARAVWARDGMPGDVRVPAIGDQLWL